MNAEGGAQRWLLIAVVGLGLNMGSPCPARAAEAAARAAEADACARVSIGSATSSLGLGDAVDLALCHNPQLEGAWAAIRLQAAALGEARAAYLPTANLSAGELADRTRYPGAEQASTSVRAHTLYASLNWRLFDFGGRDANVRVAEALLAAARANNQAQILRTSAQVIDAYFSAQTAKGSWLSKEKSEQLARRTLDAAQRRERLGTGSRTDALQADAALAKVSLEKSRARGAYQKTISLLVYAMGIAPLTPITLAEEDAEPVDVLRRDLASWMQAAADRHPAIQAARAQLEGAQAKRVSVQSEGLPTVDLAGNFYQNGRPNQGPTPARTREMLVGVTLNIPIFEGFARGEKLRGAQAQIEQQEAALRDTEGQVLMEVVKAHADAMAALDNLGASQRWLTAAENSLASIQRKFDRGAADMVDMLQSQSALSDAQEERVRSLAEWRSAHWRLLVGVGLQCTRDRSVCEGDSPNLVR